ncbi:MAG TPA: TIGR00159 family protein, partial [Verrucomicrobiales bacterium]|nr:TIGR00159 family protein [Verrucomicrobiales bacterium]
MIFDASWETLWRPVVEISILAVGIYFILMFVRRTHGWGVFIGFLVLLGVL